MSLPLPPEILDLIVDHLHDEPTTLRACCLVSKSWIPRTRRHLFARVEFRSSRLFKLWMKAFPDSSNSPAHYTRSLDLAHFSDATSPQVLDFICSFPLLEDLTLLFSLYDDFNDDDEWDVPPTAPKFTGSLYVDGSNRYIARKLLHLPSGLHFSKVTVLSDFGFIDVANELVSGCSGTLEFLVLELYQSASSTTSVVDQS